MSVRNETQQNKQQIDNLVQQARWLKLSPESADRLRQSLEERLATLQQKQDRNVAIQTENTRQHLLPAPKTTLAKKQNQPKKQNRLNRELKFSDNVRSLAKAKKLDQKILKQFFESSAIERDRFVDICSKLDLQTQDVVNREFLNLVVSVVPKIRAKCYCRIQDRCGTLRILDVARPIDLETLYVDVNVLEEPEKYRWFELKKLLQIHNSKTDEVDRFGLGAVRQERVPGLDVVETSPKVMVLGKPGAGKSTFLQHVAIGCNQGRLQIDRVPVFIRLRALADNIETVEKFNVLAYLYEEFNDAGVSDRAEIDKLLFHGRLLLLLDGLDEVPGKYTSAVVKGLEQFFQQYPDNQFIITCRIAAQNFRFSGFLEIEIADFNAVQIEDFARKWFVAVDKNSDANGKRKASQFIEKINLAENQPIRELAVTPILLVLTCLVFQAKAEFPANRTRLYTIGLDILLRKWDVSRGIQRDAVYRNLALSQKIELLTRVAAATFAKTRYFFEQTEVERLIAAYLQSLPDPNPVLDLNNSRDVLKAIEVQHGLLVERAQQIYSFSHLTFQEYFTARHFVVSPDLAVKQFIRHINDVSWREVFLLVRDMPWSAASLLLLQQQIEALVAADDSLQQFLYWVGRKALAPSPYQKSALRAFYLAFALDRGVGRALDLARSLDSRLAAGLNYLEDNPYAQRLMLDFDLQLDLDLILMLNRARIRDFTHDEDNFRAQKLQAVRARARDRIQALDIACSRNISPAFRQALQTLREKLPDPETDGKTIERWWNAIRQSWTQELRATMIQYRDIGHDWQFNETQRALLHQYYAANQLLIDSLKSSLKSGYDIPQEFAEQIENTIILPNAKVEQMTLHESNPPTPVSSTVQSDLTAPDAAPVSVSDLEIPRPKRRTIWADGSFWLVLFVVVVGGVIALANFVPGYLVPVIAIATLIVIILLGVLVLRREGDFSSTDASKLITRIVKALPLLNNKSK